MDVTQLRIGNFINNNVECTQITKSDLKFLLHGDNEHYANPVQLTKEWLLALGFIHDKEYNEYYYSKGLLTINIPDVHYKNGRIYYNSFCIIKEWPKSVHQLQNLYFALTGEELVIKSND